MRLHSNRGSEARVISDLTAGVALLTGSDLFLVLNGVVAFEIPRYFLATVALFFKVVQPWSAPPETRPASASNWPFIMAARA